MERFVVKSNNRYKIIDSREVPGRKPSGNTILSVTNIPDGISDIEILKTLSFTVIHFDDDSYIIPIDYAQCGSGKTITVMRPEKGAPIWFMPTDTELFSKD